MTDAEVHNPTYACALDRPLAKRNAPHHWDHGPRFGRKRLVALAAPTPNSFRTHKPHQSVATSFFFFFSFFLFSSFFGVVFRGAVSRCGLLLLACCSAFGLGSRGVFSAALAGAFSVAFRFCGPSLPPSRLPAAVLGRALFVGVRGAGWAAGGGLAAVPPPPAPVLQRAIGRGPVAALGRLAAGAVPRRRPAAAPRALRAAGARGRPAPGVPRRRAALAARGPVRPGRPAAPGLRRRAGVVSPAARSPGPAAAGGARPRRRARASVVAPGAWRAPLAAGVVCLLIRHFHAAFRSFAFSRLASTLLLSWVIAWPGHRFAWLELHVAAGTIRRTNFVRSVAPRSRGVGGNLTVAKHPDTGGRFILVAGAETSGRGQMVDSTFTVCLVDDDLSVLSALSRFLRGKGYDVRGFSLAQDFLDQHDPSNPGCAILDLSMPGLDGFSLQQALTDGGAPWPVIFLTGKGDIPASVRAMRAGAIDFLTKPARKEDLLLAISRAKAWDVQVRQARAELAAVQSMIAKLTPREREVLSHVVAGRLNKQIAGDLGTVEKTIKFHRSRMMRKLGVRTVADLVRLAEKAGISLPKHNSHLYWS